MVQIRAVIFILSLTDGRGLSAHSPCTWVSTDLAHGVSLVPRAPRVLLFSCLLILVSEFSFLSHHTQPPDEHHFLSSDSVFLSFNLQRSRAGKKAKSAVPEYYVLARWDRKFVNPQKLILLVALISNISWASTRRMFTLLLLFIYLFITCNAYITVTLLVQEWIHYR